MAAAYFDNLTGMFVAWLLSMLMGVAYMIHLSKPMRFWRMFMKPKTSWIARGFIFIMLFIGLTFVTLILRQWFPEATGAITTFKVLASIFAFAQSIYTGFAVSYVSAIKVWNSAIVPVLFVTCGLTGGLAILLAITMAGGGDVVVLENVIRIVLIALAVIIGVYLWNTTYSSTSARDAVKRLIGGSLAPLFWVGVFLFGIAIPVIISVATYYSTGEASSGLLITAVTSEIIGGLALRFAILKAGVYTPLLPAD
jgi:formate-dependent nitrite reductase membrane component NrfD